MLLHSKKLLRKLNALVWLMHKTRPVKMQSKKEQFLLIFTPRTFIQTKSSFNIPLGCTISMGYIDFNHLFILLLKYILHFHLKWATTELAESQQNACFWTFNMCSVLFNNINLKQSSTKCWGYVVFKIHHESERKCQGQPVLV